MGAGTTAPEVAMRRPYFFLALGLLVLSPRVASASRPAHAAPGTICADEDDGDGSGGGGGGSDGDGDGSGGGGGGSDDGE
jgi:hypothetical protein